MKLFTTMPTPVGDMLLVGSRESGRFTLTGAYFIGQRHELALDDGWCPDPEAFASVTTQLDEYFAGRRVSFDLPLEFHGTPFQESVWRTLQEIPYGTTWSYRELAEKSGHGGKVRAVAAAVGRNRIGVIVPCHRVIGSDGSLTGYAAGLDRKRWLLAREGVILPG